MRLAKLIFASLAFGGACGPAAVSGGGAASASGAPTRGAPALVDLTPGVEVVTGWSVPVFFADDYFWSWDGGTWYRSATLGGPRVVVRQIPVAVARIYAPWRYANYDVSDRVARRPIPHHHVPVGAYHAMRRR